MGSKEVVHRLFCADGDGIAAGGVVADEGQILVFQLGVSGHLLVVGRHTEHVFGLVLQQKAAELGGVQVRDDDDLQPQGQRHVDAAGVAIGDEGGHDVHERLPLPEQGMPCGKLLGEGVEVPVRQHDALGGAGGAAGVDHHTGMVGVIGIAGGAGVLPVCDELLPHQGIGVVLVAVGVGDFVADGQRQGQRVGRGKHDDPLHMGAPGGLTAAVVHHVQADQQMGIHFLDVLMDAVGAVPGVHQIQGRADAVGGVERIDDLRGHHADHGDDITLSDARRPEGSGSLLGVHDEVCIGELPAIIFKGRFRQAVLVLLPDKVESRTFRHRLVDVIGVVIFEPRASL